MDFTTNRKGLVFTNSACISEGGSAGRTYVFLTLNILGVIGCVLVTIVLVLWALNLIFPEPNIALEIKIYLEELQKYPNRSMRITEHIFSDAFSEF